MEYFDKNLLDNQTIERVEKTLNGIETILREYSLLPQYREFYTKAGEELLDYYYNRLEQEEKKPIPTTKEIELPF